MNERMSEQVNAEKTRFFAVFSSFYIFLFHSVTDWRSGALLLRPKILEVMSDTKKIIEETLAETKQLVRELPFRNFNLGEEITAEQLFYDSYEEAEQYKLCQWFSFFNKHYDKCICIHTLLIHATIDFMDSNELFRTQPSFGMEVSQEFFRRIFYAGFFLEVQEEYRYDEDLRIDPIDTIKDVFMTALVYGTYWKLKVNDTLEAIQFLSEGIKLNSVGRMFSHLFMRFENPKIFSRNLVRLTADEIDIMMFVLQGNNICNHAKIPFRLSKKEAHFLVHTMQWNTFKNQVLKRGIAVAKLLARVKDDKLISHFTENCRSFEYIIDDFIRDIDFWADAYKLMLEFVRLNNGSIERSQIDDFVDFFDYMKYDSGENYSLKGRTLASVDRAMHEWHRHAVFQDLEKRKNVWWKKMAIEISVEHDNEKYLFRELINGNDLFIESKIMKHCVFTYVQNCQFGRSEIWSMMKEVNGIFENYLTIELRKDCVVQVRGKHNASANLRDMNIIHKWNEQRKIAVSVSSNESEISA